MKESIFDVLIYLFDNYIVDELAVDPDQDELAQELAGAGFETASIDKAFTWLDGLLDECDTEAVCSVWQSDSLRFFSVKEQQHLGDEGVSLISRLVNVGLLNQANRETVIHRVMALGTKKVALDHLRWVILMVLGNQQGFNEIAEWAEVIIAGGDALTIH